MSDIYELSDVFLRMPSMLPIMSHVAPSDILSPSDDCPAILPTRASLEVNTSAGENNESTAVENERQDDSFKEFLSVDKESISDPDEALKRQIEELAASNESNHSVHSDNSDGAVKAAALFKFARVSASMMLKKQRLIRKETAATPSPSDVLPSPLFIISVLPQTTILAHLFQHQLTHMSPHHFPPVSPRWPILSPPLGTFARNLYLKKYSRTNYNELNTYLNVHYKDPQRRFNVDQRKVHPYIHNLWLDFSEKEKERRRNSISNNNSFDTTDSITFESSLSNLIGSFYGLPTACNIDSTSVNSASSIAVTDGSEDPPHLVHYNDETEKYCHADSPTEECCLLHYHLLMSTSIVTFCDSQADVMYYCGGVSTLSFGYFGECAYENKPSGIHHYSDEFLMQDAAQSLGEEGKENLGQRENEPQTLTDAHNSYSVGFHHGVTNVDSQNCTLSPSELSSNNIYGLDETASKIKRSEAVTHSKKKLVPCDIKDSLCYEVPKVEEASFVDAPLSESLNSAHTPYSQANRTGASKFSEYSSCNSIPGADAAFNDFPGSLKLAQEQLHRDSSPLRREQATFLRIGDLHEKRSSSSLHLEPDPLNTDDADRRTRLVNDPIDAGTMQIYYFNTFSLEWPYLVTSHCGIPNCELLWVLSALYEGLVWLVIKHMETQTRTLSIGFIWCIISLIVILNKLNVLGVKFLLDSTYLMDLFVRVSYLSNLCFS